MKNWKTVLTVALVGLFALLALFGLVPKNVINAAAKGAVFGLVGAVFLVIAIGVRAVWRRIFPKRGDDA